MTESSEEAADKGSHSHDLLRSAARKIYGAGITGLSVNSIQQIIPIRALTEISNADPSNIQQVGASQLALSTSYYENVLVQAKRSFIAAIISAAIGLAFFIASVSILLIRDDLRAGTVSAISGAIVEVISGLNFWLYGRTASQMNAFHVRLDQTQRFLLANSIASNLSEDNRDLALTELMRQVANPVTSGDSNARPTA